MKLTDILNVRPGMIALIGGGGKTTLLYTLAEELRQTGTVLLCTSTHILAPPQYPLVMGGAADIRRALHRSGAVCAGTPAEGGKLTAPAAGFSELTALAEYVLVEADGARGLPMKAHAPHEPVIPSPAGNVILVVGADGFGQPIASVCHRPDLWARLAGVDIDDVAAPVGEARVICAEGFGDRVFINKTESDAARVAAADLARRLECPVAAGSLQKGEYLCLR